MSSHLARIFVDCQDLVVVFLHILIERRHSQVVGDSWLWCRESPEGHEIDPGLT